VQLGAIGETQPGAGAIFKGAAAASATVSPLPHITITGASTFTGPADIQTGIVSVSVTGTLASSSEIKVSGATSKLDVAAIASGYAIPTAQKLSGIGDWDGRIILDGILAPGNGGIGTMTGDSLTLDGAGRMQLELSTINSTSDKLTLSSAFDKGSAGAFQFDFGNGGAPGQTYSLVQFASSTFAPTNFTYINLASGLTGSFVMTPTEIAVRGRTGARCVCIACWRHGPSRRPPPLPARLATRGALFRRFSVLRDNQQMNSERRDGDFGPLALLSG
jgi:hypothetical protein